MAASGLELSESDADQEGSSGTDLKMRRKSSYAPLLPQEGSGSMMERLRARMGIHTSLERLPTGELVEDWHFEEDTYTVAILGIVQEGFPAAAPKLAVALVPPLLQGLILCTILERLISTGRDPDGDTPSSNATVGKLVSTICFILMSLNLSNEALEGIWKICFSIRAFRGVYADLKGHTAWVAIGLAFIQFVMAVYTVGTSTLVIAEQPSALDAFMNFVALAFLTEIDNVVFSSRTLGRVLSGGATDIRVTHAAKGEDEHGSAPWTLGSVLVSNILVMFATFMNLFTCVLFAQALHEDQGEVLSLRQVVGSIMALLVLDAMMWFGSRIVNTVSCAVGVAMLCVFFVFANQWYIYHTHLRLLPAVVPMVPFWFAMLAASSGNAVVADPFPLLRCPFQTPSIVWALLLAASLELQAIYYWGV